MVTASHDYFDLFRYSLLVLIECELLDDGTDVVGGQEAKDVGRK
jgi:hypothetical protein